MNMTDCYKFKMKKKWIGELMRCAPPAYWHRSITDPKPRALLAKAADLIAPQAKWINVKLNSE